MKEMIERQNDLKTEAESILNNAKAEKRSVSAEEKERFDNITKEIDDIENTLEMEEKVNKMEKKEIKSENMTVEEKDIHNFAKLIRNFNTEINNDASQYTKGSNGALIPTTIVKKILDRVEQISPIYASATKYVEKGTLIIPKIDNSEDDITVDYATEFSELVEHAPKSGSVSLSGFLVGALAKISKSLLKNTDFDLVNEVVNRMATKFKVFIEKELLNGTSNKITGIVGSYDSTNMKITLAKKSTITADELIDIQETVIDDYQENSYWIMNRKTRKAIRKLKDGDGNYLLNRNLDSKWGYELLGKPVYTTDRVNELGTATKPVIFYGDFSGLAVKHTEELEINILLERYATQHAIGVCGYTELDAKVENTQKIAVAYTGTTD